MAHLERTLRRINTQSMLADTLLESMTPEDNNGLSPLQRFRVGAYCVIAVRRMRHLYREPLRPAEREKLVKIYFLFLAQVGINIDSFQQIRDLIATCGVQIDDSVLDDFLQRVGYKNGNFPLRYFLRVMTMAKRKYRHHASVSDTECAFSGLLGGSTVADLGFDVAPDESTTEDIDGSIWGPMEQSAVPEGMMSSSALIGSEQFALSSTLAEGSPSRVRDAPSHASAPTEVSVAALIAICRHFNLSWDTASLFGSIDHGHSKIDFAEFSDLLAASSTHSSEATTPQISPQQKPLAKSGTRHASLALGGTFRAGKSFKGGGGDRTMSLSVGFGRHRFSSTFASPRSLDTTMRLLDSGILEGIGQDGYSDSASEDWATTPILENGLTVEETLIKIKEELNRDGKLEERKVELREHNKRVIEHSSSLCTPRQVQPKHESGLVPAPPPPQSQRPRSARDASQDVDWTAEGGKKSTPIAPAPPPPPPSRPYSAVSSAFGTSAPRFYQKHVHILPPAKGNADVKPKRDHMRNHPVPPTQTRSSEEGLRAYKEAKSRKNARSARRRESSNWTKQAEYHEDNINDKPDYKVFNPFLGVTMEELRPQHLKHQRLRSSLPSTMANAASKHPAGDAYLREIADTMRRQKGSRRSSLTSSAPRSPGFLSSPSSVGFGGSTSLRGSSKI